MKLTRKQLNRIIQEALSYQNEGIFDTIKKGISNVGDRLEYGTTTKEMLKNSSQDALDLYNAMAKLGTVEEKVREIIEKRSEDLDKLYLEYNNLITNWVKANATGIVSGGSSIKIKEYNQDLIAWLEGDGMKEEAVLVQTAIEEKKIQRKKIPTKVKGLFG